jgi:hypothetical protein
MLAHQYEQVVALYAYQAQKADELSITAGEVLNVITKGADGWWKTQSLAGKEGVVPSNYVQAK